MTPEETPSPSDAGSNPSRPRRRSRRGGRGRRRRPASGATASAEAASPELDSEEQAEQGHKLTGDTEAPEAVESAADSTPEPSDVDTAEPMEEDSTRAEAFAEAEVEAESAPVPPPPAKRADFRPASPAAVTEAIEEVNRVIASLKQVLDTMEEVLETLELAEIQKTADEREIHSLREALRQFDRAGGEPRRPRHEERRHGRR